MSLLWAIARKLLGLQCSSFAQRCSYILSWEWLWSFGLPHSTAKVYKEVPPLPNKMMKIQLYMSLLWANALKLLGLQCPSFAQRYPYILSWKWLWSFGWPYSTAEIRKLSPPLSRKMIKICNSGYAQKKSLLGLDFFGDKYNDTIYLLYRDRCEFLKMLFFYIGFKWSSPTLVRERCIEIVVVLRLALLG